MEDDRQMQKSLRELEFNHLNIHLYLTLNYETASEHLDFDFMVLYNIFVLSWSFTITSVSSDRYLIRQKIPVSEPIPDIGSMNP